MCFCISYSGGASATANSRHCTAAYQRLSRLNCAMQRSPRLGGRPFKGGAPSNVRLASCSSSQATRGSARRWTNSFWPSQTLEACRQLDPMKTIHTWKLKRQKIVISQCSQATSKLDAPRWQCNRKGCSCHEKDQDLLDAWSLQCQACVCMMRTSVTVTFSVCEAPLANPLDA